MAALTTMLLAGGLALGAAGTMVQYSAQKQQAAANAAALEEQQKQDRLRQQQMNLDAERRKREIIRQSIAARSSALSAAAYSGSNGSGASILPGAYAGIAGQTGNNLLAVNQNQALGNDIFASNNAMLGDYRSAASAAGTAAFGGMLTSLGGSVLNNIGTISRVGTYFGSKLGFA